MSSLRLALKQSLQEASAEGVVIQKKKKVTPAKRGDGHDSDSSEENEASLQDLADHDNDSDGSSSSEESGEVITDKKKQQHSAAHKIQNQFRKKKDKKAPAMRTKKKKNKAKSESSLSSSQQKRRSSNSSDRSEDKHKKQQRNRSENCNYDSDDEGDDDDSRSSAASTTWTVSPPSEAVVRYMLGLSVETCRSSVVPGLRVKVQFDRSAWYGGRVSAVTKDGSKIRIQYDDGTTEVTPFPDSTKGSVDIVVDAVANGQHAAAATEAARVFLPPPVATTRTDVEASAKRPSLEPAKPPSLESAKRPSLEPVKRPSLESVKRPSLESAKRPSLEPAERPSLEPDKKEPPVPAKEPPMQEKPAVELRPSMKQDFDSAEEGELPVPYVASKPSYRPDAMNDARMDEAAEQKSDAAATVTAITTTADRDAIAASADVPNEATAVALSPKDLSASNEMQLPDKADARPSTGTGGTHGEDEPPKPKRKRGRPPKHRPAETIEVHESDRGDARWNEADPADTQRGAPEAPSDRFSDVVEKESSSASAEVVPLEDASRAAVTQEHAPSDTTNRPWSGSLPHLKIRMPKSTGEHGARTAKSPRIPCSPGAAADAERPASAMSNGSMRSGSSVPKKKRLSGEALTTGDQPPPKKLSIRIPVHKVKHTLQEAGKRTPGHEKQISTDQTKGVTSTEESTLSDIAASPRKAAVEKVSSAAQDKPAKVIEEVGSALGATPQPGPHVSVKIFASGSAMSPKSPKQLKKLNKKKLLAAAAAEGLLIKTAREQQETGLADGQIAPVGELPLPEAKTTKERTRTPIPLTLTTDDIGDVSEGQDHHGHHAIVASKNSAFVGKDDTVPSTETVVEVTEGKRFTPIDDLGKVNFLLDGPIRSERRAAQQANERIVAKQDVALQDQVTAKKKRKRDRRKDAEGGSHQPGAEDFEDDSQWVQCDKCGKWRIIPSSVVQLLPKQWYCSDNSYDPKRASCDALEQTAKEVAKEKKKRLKKRQRMIKAAEAAAAAAAEGSSTQKPNSKGLLRKDNALEYVRSPRPPRDAQEDVEKPSKSPTRTSPIDEAEVPNAPSDARPRKEKKVSTSLGKKGRSIDSIEKLVQWEPAAADVVKPRGRGRPRRNQNKESTAGGSGQPHADDADNLEWVQCETCDKWRKLPPHVSADDLPDVWTCDLNDWNPASASCDAPEDKAEGLQDIGVFGSSGSNAGKLTYRHLIFGSTGRKANRPISERTRAAESIFATQFEEDDAPSKVLYAESSAFVSRGRPNISIEENEGMSVLELMSHSQLWRELRGSSQPPAMKISSSMLNNEVRWNSYTFDTLPLDAQQLVKEYLLRVLDVGSLSGDDVVLRAQSINLGALPEDLRKCRPLCTKNVVITTLCELVKEGKVECIQKTGTIWPMNDWNPRYRLALNRSSPPMEVQSPMPLETTARKVSHFMKISKPWKRAKI